MRTLSGMQCLQHAVGKKCPKLCIPEHACQFLVLLQAPVATSVASWQQNLCSVSLSSDYRKSKSDGARHFWLLRPVSDHRAAVCVNNLLNY